MRELSDYGGLVLATRLRRLSEMLFAGVDSVYQAQGVEVSARCVPMLLLLRDNGPTGITDIARQLGQTHPAVSQMSRTLARGGLLVNKTDAGDDRRRLLGLSRKGTALMARMARTWNAVTGAVDDLGATVSADLPALVTALESALGEQPFAVRIEARARLQERAAVEIIPFEPRYRDDFKRLNVEWLEKYFYVEAFDDHVLSHPEAVILKPGGFIFFARYQGAIVGTCALIRVGRRRVEFSKMAVTERCQGLGIGRRLLLAAIRQFETMGVKELFLESSRKLEPALALYESQGFVHAPRPKMETHYHRSDVYMVYSPGRRGAGAPRQPRPRPATSRTRGGRAAKA
jgi:GNAT superfamily N-acetyltransferase